MKNFLVYFLLCGVYVTLGIYLEKVVCVNWSPAGWSTFGYMSALVVMVLGHILTEKE